MYRLAVMRCPALGCPVAWGFSPAEPAAYWVGRNATHNKIMDHVITEHPWEVIDVMAQIGITEEAWWSLEQVEIP